MNLFIQQLDAIADTLEQSDGKGFNMGNWYNSYSNECGYVACVCGEHALKGNLSLFPLTRSIDKSVSLENLAHAVATDLRTSCFNCCSIPSLAASVYSPTSRARRNNLFKVGFYEMFNLEVRTVLQKHPHVTTVSSAVLAADYIRLLIKSLTEDVTHFTLEGTL
jgi:hypothetical protein